MHTEISAAAPGMSGDGETTRADAGVRAKLFLFNIIAKSLMGCGPLLVNVISM